MWTKVIILVLLFWLSGAGRVPEVMARDLACGWIHHTPGQARMFYMWHDRRWRSYRLYVPQSYRPGAALVLDFHGQTSSSSNQAALSCWQGLADREGAVVVWPQALGFPSTWDAGDYCCSPRGQDDEGFALRLVQCLTDSSTSKLQLDSRRVYAVGLSNGAAMAGRLACNHSDVIAGAALASQSFPYYSAESCRAEDAQGGQKAAFPVVEVRGKRDFIVPFYVSLGWSATAKTSLTRWARASRCVGDPVVSDICDQGNVGPACEYGRGVCKTYDNCEDGVAVTQCAVDDNHYLYVNPHRFDVCAAAWQQFQQFPGRR